MVTPEKLVEQIAIGAHDGMRSGRVDVKPVEGGALAFGAGVNVAPIVTKLTDSGATILARHDHGRAWAFVTTARVEQVEQAIAACEAFPRLIPVRGYAY